MTTEFWLFVAGVVIAMLVFVLGWCCGMGWCLSKVADSLCPPDKE